MNYTQNYNLNLPDHGFRDWDTPINANFTTLDTTIKNLDDQNVKLTGDQTIAGVKTFSSSPIVPTPAVGSNDAIPATTAYIETKFQKVAALPSPADSNIWYFIKE